MINAADKGAGLAAAIAAAGHWLEWRDGTWHADDDVAVQAIIDAYPLAACQREIAADIAAHAKSLRDAVVAGISPAEMAAWSIKLREATAWTASGNPADAPMLGLEAQARGTPVAELAARVLRNAAQLAALEAVIAGTAGRHTDAVMAADMSFAAALGYDWHTGWPQT